MDLTNVPDNLKAAVTKRHANSPLAHLDQKQLAQDVIQRYVKGERLADIAPEYGIPANSTALYQAVVEQAPDDWKRAVTSKALHRHQQAIDHLENAEDMLNITRGRELARVAQWELERVCRPIYGQDVPSLTVNLNVQTVSNQINQLERELGIIHEHSPTDPA